MLAYDASDKIAEHIANQVGDNELYIYDSQTFASLQTYEAYDATVSAFEMIYENFIPKEGRSNWIAAAGGAQTIASTLSALRSTAEYAGETVNLQTDPVIAQVAKYLKDKKKVVVIPKFLLTSPSAEALKSACPAGDKDCVAPTDDLGSVGPDALQRSITDKATRPCADIQWTVPDQIGCLLLLRKKAATAALAPNPKKEGAYINPSAAAAFAEFDKLFQVFFGQLMGTSVNLSSKGGSQTASGGGGGGGSGTQQGGSGGGGGGAQKGGGGGGGGSAQEGGSGGQQDDGSGNQAGSNPTGNQSVSVPLLSQIIQGHRLKARFGTDHSRILVLEATEAGGGLRIKHNFFVELFWTTPTPTFTGGSIVTYFLISPKTSIVENSEVLRFTYDYGKFHGDKDQKQCNFQDGCPNHFK